MTKWEKARIRKKNRQNKLLENKMFCMEKEKDMYENFCKFLLSGGIVMVQKSRNKKSYCVLPASMIEQLSKKKINILRTAPPLNDYVMEVKDSWQK